MKPSNSGVDKKKNNFFFWHTTKWVLFSCSKEVGGGGRVLTIQAIREGSYFHGCCDGEDQCMWGWGGLLHLHVYPPQQL